MSENRITRRKFVHDGSAVAAAAIACLGNVGASNAAGETGKKRIVFVAGPVGHAPGTHEAAAEARLLKHCIDGARDLGQVDTAIYYRWPEHNDDLDGASTIVFTGDLFPPAVIAKEKAGVESKIKALMEQGCGIVCLHYATGLKQEHLPVDGEHLLLSWLGGYFASDCKHHRSTYKTFEAEFVPEGRDHPIHRGWKAFKLREEVYYNIYFGKQGLAKNVTPFVCCMVPPEEPKKEVVGWAVVRSDGGRGVGFVAPHFYHNWRLDDMRMLVLNSIVWSAKIDVPHGGVKSSPPDLSEFQPRTAGPRPQAGAFLSGKS